MDPKDQNQNLGYQQTGNQVSNSQTGANAAPPVSQQPVQPPPAFSQPVRKPTQSQAVESARNQSTTPNHQSNSIPLSSTPLNPRVAQVPNTNASSPQTPQSTNSTPNSATTGDGSGTVYRSPSLNNYVGSTDDKQKDKVFLIAILGFAVVLILGAVIFFLFSGSDEEGAVVSGSDLENEESAAQIPVVEKDSILRSADSGQTFSTYFKVVTDQEVGLVDVLTISFHPETSGEIIVTTYDDGLFISENTGDTWDSIAFTPQRIYSFVLDRANPDSRAFASGIVSENGRIFRTDDKGQSWRVVYAEPGNGTFVSALTQDPINPNVILAGTNKGTFVRSLDSGDTWENIGQSIKYSIDDFTHDATKQSFVYLLSKGDVYHSSDAGKSWENWEEIKDQEIDDLTEQERQLRRDGDKEDADWIKKKIEDLKEKNKEQGLPSGIIEIVADPSRTGILYAGLKSGLYRSTDYGKYWNEVNIIESAEQFPIPSIAINPEDSDEISFVAGSSFYRSVNYGKTWAVTPLDKTRNASFVTYDPFDTETVFIGLSAQD